MKRDDEDWFDLLAGRQVAAADTATKQEALALREAILKMQPRQAEVVIRIDALRRFKKRLQDEGLLAAPSRNAPRWMAMAATLVMCGGLVMLLREQTGLQQGEVAEISRGASNPQVVIVKQALQEAKILQQNLAPLGIQLRIQGDAELSTVEAFVPADQEEKVNAMLLPYQKVVGSDGHLLLEFHAQGKRP